MTVDVWIECQSCPTEFEPFEGCGCPTHNLCPACKHLCTTERAPL